MKEKRGLTPLGFGQLQEELEELNRKGLYRQCRRVDAVEGGRILVEGKWKIHLGSNSYLGLNFHPRVIAVAQEASDRYGTGAGSARLIGGTLPPHEALEAELARFKRAEACLLFSTGYMANLGVVTTLVGAEDLILCDRLNHASLIDACRLSRAAFRVYPHGDLHRLSELLKRRRGRYRRTLVVTEGLFSMDGDSPALDEMARLVRGQDAWLLVDDAHATGVMGAHGRGSLEHFGVSAEGILQMGTLSKALGSLGGYLAGPREVVELLRNRARSFIYTTALPASCAAAALEALKVLQEEPKRRQRLWENARRWTTGLARQGWDLLSDKSPIVPVRIGSSRQAVALSNVLSEAGVYAPGIRPPTVPTGSARIRTSVTALHTKEDLETALTAFERSRAEDELV